MTIIEGRAVISSAIYDDDERVITIPSELEHIEKDRRVRRVCVGMDTSSTSLWMNLYYGSTYMGRIYVHSGAGAVLAVNNAIIRPHDSMLVCPAGQKITIKWNNTRPGSDYSVWFFIDQEELN